MSDSTLGSGHAGLGNYIKIFQGEVLKEDVQKIDQIRAKFDDLIMAIDGVESISIGLTEQGKTCLMLGASVPVEKIRDKLPKEIFKIPVKIIYIGKVKAQ